MLHHLSTKEILGQYTNELSSGDDTLPAVTNKDVAELSTVGVRYTLLILMVGYALIAIHHLFFLSSPHNMTMLAVAGLTSVFFMTLYLFDRLAPFPKHLANPLLILIGIIALGNVVVQCVLLGDEKYLAYFILVTIGVSLVFFSWRMLLVFYVLVLASFIWTLQFIHPAPDYTHQIFVMSCSFFIGFLSVTVRIKALRHLLLSRKLAQLKSDRLADALSASQRGVKAQQDNHSKSNFLAHMSHELRTPLTAIIGFSEIIKLKMFGSLENNRYADYIDDIHSSSEHLLSLVNDILDLSKLEENMVEVNLTTVSLGDVLERCLSMVRERAQQHKVCLQYVELGEDRDIYCDPLRLKQIILNLLSNAVKFTPISGTVILEARFDEGENLTIEVRDTGVGMSKDEIQNAMEPFWQAKAYRSSPNEGTGLGLALSKELAILLGGHLEIESQPKVGTTARLVLPCDAVKIPSGHTICQETPVPHSV